jgi:hypothetical protein
MPDKSKESKSKEMKLSDEVPADNAGAKEEDSQTDKWWVDSPYVAYGD